MYKILMVEDDMVIARKTTQFLGSWGYDAKCVEVFDRVLETVNDWNPDLVIMDVSLPYRNGFEWTRQIRLHSKVPILFLSSADDAMNIVTAVSQGADDYMTKSFDMQVLAFKIQALLRRTYDFAGKTQTLEHHGLRFNTDENTISLEGRTAELTRNEARILRMLMERRNVIVSREDLMEGLWKTDCYVDENALSVNVNRLRKKLDSIGAAGFIETKKGIGYRLCAD